MRILNACLLTAWLAVPLFSQNTNVTLLSTFTYPNQTLANVWGYAGNGHEFALVGAKNGLSIVDVTNPANPVELKQIPGPSSSWREIKTYQHYAYVVTEGAGGGVLIVNLSNLPDTTNIPYKTYTGNGAISGLSTVHALHVDETQGFLYLYGSNLFGGRPIVLNLNPDPYNPTYAGYFNSNFSGNHNYVHDGYVDNNIMFAGHIFGGFFSVVNMTNKTNPTLITTQQTPGLFTHNTWRSGNTLFTTDEVNNSFLAAYDISDFGNITLLDKIQSNPGSNSVVHNTHIIDDYAVTSWYKDGFTIVDVSRPDNLVQVGNYDTWPNGAGPGFEGCWGVYPYLPSGNILATNIPMLNTNNGQLFVLSPTYMRGCYVEGEITNAMTGQPLQGALVELLGTNTGETSNLLGIYKMGQLQSGSFTARVSKLGFVSQDIPVSLANGEVTVLNVVLAPVGFPVEMTRFTVEAEGRAALLRWSTASEVDNEGFEVQHGRSIHQWATQGFVPAQGHRDAPADYEYRIPDLLPGTHFFRLRQVDTDGTNTFSEVRSLTMKGQAFQAAFRPNAVHDVGELYFFTEKPRNVRVEIFNAAGLPVGLQWELDVADAATLSIEASRLPNGVYFAVVQTEYERVVAQFLKI
ncbi:MAG: choice-of-anchor B family protein [Saprospiraceae bacterium]|nr:choice-of-anchor B family protein [Saprospiraceae bacterium]